MEFNQLDSATPVAERGRRWFYCALLVICIFALYWPSLSAPFVFDDYWQIVFTGKVRDYHLLMKIEGSRAITSGTFALNFYLGRYDPWGYRLFNIAVHAAAALTLFGIVRRTLQLPNVAPSLAGMAEWIALEIALIWAVHPLQTQSVTYITQRHESLMGLFYLLAIYGVLRGSQAKIAWVWYALSIFAILFGSHTKEVMVTAPVVVLLFDRTYLVKSWRALLRWRWDVYLGMFILSRHLFLFAIGMLGDRPSRYSSAGFSVVGLSPWEYLRTQPQVILHYLRLAVWPDVLCIDYRWPVANGFWEIALPGAVVLGLVLASLCAYVRWPRIGFLGVTLFLILAPTSSFVPILDLAVEHRMYLPLAPLITLAVIGWHRAWQRLPANWGKRLRRVPHLMLIAVALLLATRTNYRNADYLDPLVLWTQALEMSPKDDRALENLRLHRQQNW